MDVTAARGELITRFLQSVLFLHKQDKIKIQLHCDTQLKIAVTYNKLPSLLIDVRATSSRLPRLFMELSTHSLCFMNFVSFSAHTIFSEADGAGKINYFVTYKEDPFNKCRHVLWHTVWSRTDKLFLFSSHHFLL